MRNLSVTFALNMVEASIDLFSEILGGASMAGCPSLSMAEPETLETIVAVERLLVEMCQGPNFANQDSILEYKSMFLVRCVNSMITWPPYTS